MEILFIDCSEDGMSGMIGAAELAAKLSGIAFDFLMSVGCEAFCEVLDIGKDIFFEAIKSGKIDLKTKKSVRKSGSGNGRRS